MRCKHVEPVENKLFYNIVDDLEMILKKVLVFLNICTVIVISKYCYWNSGCSYKLFSSKTPYGTIRGDIRDNILKIKGCEPISIWSIYRHGQRNPGVEFGRKIKEVLTLKDEIIESYAKGRSSFCAQDIDNLRKWVKNETMFEKAYYLTDEGYEELLGIGRRLREAYPHFLSNLESGSYTFRSGYGHWMENSAKAFVEGLAGDINNIVIENPRSDYDFITPYRNCNKYQKGVKENPLTYEEAEKYLLSSEFIAVKERLQNRMGINYILTEENVTSIYDICRYESSGIENKLSPWCALFTADDLRVLEYVGDLRHYYRNSYGIPLNLKFGEIPLQDLYEKFYLAKENKAKKIIGYFTHATMIDMIYSALGLFKDDFVLNGSERIIDRKWRTSMSSTFGTNIIAVMNKCTKDDSTDYTIIFYLNERLLKICSKSWCTWNEFEEKFKPFLNTTIDFCD